jgi:hypothetical protein
MFGVFYAFNFHPSVRDDGHHTLVAPGATSVVGGTFLLPTISARLDTEIHRIWLITLGDPMTKHFAYNLSTTIQYTFYLFLHTQ